jgi:hypothetical protein
MIVGQAGRYLLFGENCRQVRGRTSDCLQELEIAIAQGDPLFPYARSDAKGQWASSVYFDAVATDTNGIASIFFLTSVTDL